MHDIVELKIPEGAWIDVCSQEWRDAFEELKNTFKDIKDAIDGCSSHRAFQASTRNFASTMKEIDTEIESIETLYQEHETCSLVLNEYTDINDTKRTIAQVNASHKKLTKELNDLIGIKNIKILINKLSVIISGKALDADDKTPIPKTTIALASTIQDLENKFKPLEQKDAQALENAKKIKDIFENDLIDKYNALVEATHSAVCDISFECSYNFDELSMPYKFQGTIEDIDPIIDNIISNTSINNETLVSSMHKIEIKEIKISCVQQVNNDMDETLPRLSDNCTINKDDFKKLYFWIKVFCIKNSNAFNVTESNAWYNEFIVLSEKLSKAFDGDNKALDKAYTAICSKGKGILDPDVRECFNLIAELYGHIMQLDLDNKPEDEKIAFKNPKDKVCFREFARMLPTLYKQSFTEPDINTLLNSVENHTDPDTSMSPEPELNSERPITESNKKQSDPFLIKREPRTGTESYLNKKENRKKVYIVQGVIVFTLSITIIALSVAFFQNKISLTELIATAITMACIVGAMIAHGIFIACIHGNELTTPNSKITGMNTEEAAASETNRSEIRAHGGT